MRQTKLRTEADVRTVLEQKCGRAVPDIIWQRLLEKRYIAEVLGAYDKDELRQSWAELLDETRYQLALLSSRKPRQTPRRPAPGADGAYWSVVRRLQAQEAVEWVAGFRRRYLSDDALNALGSLTLSMWRRNVPPGQQLINADCIAHWLARQQLLLGTAPKGEMLLFCPGGQSDWHRAPSAAFAFTGFDGPLFDLKRVCRWLEENYGWQEVDAVAYVLAGIVPPPVGALYSLQRTADGRVLVTLEIDSAMGAERVARLYRDITRQIKTKQRHRPLSPKIGALVTFVLGMPDGTWRSKMQEWNRQYPDWAYKRSELMQRDFSRAVRAINGKGVYNG